ncbi:MAG: glycosyltransferase family 9 protein [Myxococcales bacterium]|nr:glycosyltransferase family 9 protein [Myxococcales bacterium]
MSAPPTSIWVIRESALGDVILCEPVLRALADRDPGARVTLVTRPQYHPLFAAHPRLAGVLTPAEAWRVAPPDLAIDLQNRPRTRALAARAGRRSHWRKRRGLDLVRTLGGRPLHRSYFGGPHQLDRLAEAVGLPPLGPPALTLSAEAHAWARGWRPAGPIAVIAPGAGHATKRWPAERFAAVGRLLAAAGLAVVVVGGPGEGPLLERVAGPTGRVLPITEPLDRVAALVATAAVAVGNDSGVLHLAASVATPFVALFGPTPPGRWAPRGSQGRVVAHELPCAPCSDHGRRPCRLGSTACLVGVSVEAVQHALEGLQILRSP